MCVCVCVRVNNSSMVNSIIDLYKYKLFKNDYTVIELPAF